jgi:hypothetical protein
VTRTTIRNGDRRFSACRFFGSVAATCAPRLVRHCIQGSEYRPHVGAYFHTTTDHSTCMSRKRGTAGLSIRKRVLYPSGGLHFAEKISPHAEIWNVYPVVRKCINSVAKGFATQPSSDFLPCFFESWMRCGYDQVKPSRSAINDVELSRPTLVNSIPMFCFSRQSEISTAGRGM